MNAAENFAKFTLRLLLFSAAVANAQYDGNFLGVHITHESAKVPPSVKVFMPFRKSGDTYYDLRPIYQWYNLGVIAVNSPQQLGAQQKQFVRGPRPMPEWKGFDSAEVFQVLTDGLLVEQASQIIFLRNFPSKDIVDGKRISFLARRDGVYRYANTSGAISTIEQYDHGIPFDPGNQQPAPKTKSVDILQSATNSPTKESKKITMP
jgi:hypothetical protein